MISLAIYGITRHRKQGLKALCCVNHSGRQFEIVDLDAYKVCIQSIRNFAKGKQIVHKDSMVDKSTYYQQIFSLYTQVQQACAMNTTTFSILVMINLRTCEEDSTWTRKWNKRLELNPSSQQAVDRINQCSIILPGYNLELILNWTLELVIMATLVKASFNLHARRNSTQVELWGLSTSCHTSKSCSTDC